MLIGGILAALVVLGLVAVAVMRRRSDDEHSVEHYHRQLHTLEELSTHPVVGADGEDTGHDDAAFPASAFRVAGSSTVRLTEPGHTIVPPVPPPPVPNPSEPVLFDDSSADGSKPAFTIGADERAMHSINRRPRRLAGPAAAVAVVTVLIIVLIVTGLHSNTPPKHAKSSGTATTVTTAPVRSHPRSGAGTTGHQKKKTTTTTTAPAVSGPNLISANGATYQVANASYSLALSAKTGECWISATEAGNGTVLFTGVLTSGQSHTLAASGPITVIAGAPAAFAATVNGVPVQLPFGYQAPFTLRFETAGAAGATGTSGTGTVSSTTTTTTASNSGTG